MANYKSSTMNLYDSVNSVLYTTNVLSDHVEHNAGNSKPQYLLGSAVSIYKNDGTYTTDVVKDIYSLKAGQVAGRVYANTAVTTEATARAAMDVTLNNKIDLEISNRTSADNLLTALVSADKIANDALIAAETSSRSTADQEMKTNLEVQVATRVATLGSLSADLAVESARALAAEQKEATDRSTADDSLSADLAVESARALAAEQKEATDRAAGDSTLTAKLNKEIVDRAADVQTERNRINAILDGSTVDLNQLKELVDNYKLLDTNQTTQIDALNALCVSLQTQVTDLKTKLDLALFTGEVDNSVELASFSSQVTPIAADQAFPVSKNNSWYFINDPASSVNKKINWYFMGGQDGTQHKLVSELTSVSFTIKVLSNVSIPFIAVYSKRDTTTGAVNASSWHQAKKVYIVPNSSVIAVNGLYTFYVGAVPAFYSGTLVQLVEDPVSTTQGAAAVDFASKEFLTMSVGTNSTASAGNVKFEMSEFHSKFGSDSLSFRLV
jgi:hypothetical protein